MQHQEQGSEGLGGAHHIIKATCECPALIGAPHKAGEPKLYVMYDAAKPEAGKLYFTEAEWDAFVLGVKDGEFDLDEDGNLPPLPESQHQN